MTNDSIYVAIASFRDLELTRTIYSALSNAQDKDRIFFYVFSQDEDHPKLDSLFDLFNTSNYFYDKEHYSLSTGVGYARSRAQSKLTNDYRYYLQVDSHTQFSQDWDSRLIEDYERLQETWGRFVFSTYPPGYTYQKFGDIKFETDGITPALKIFDEPHAIYKFGAQYSHYYGDTTGQESAYFCAGLAFGYSEYFIKVPYDKYIYFQGEEHTMSVRFFDAGIKIVCPPSVYLFHDYSGHKRKRNWENNDGWEKNEQVSADRLRKFFEGDLLDGFGVSPERYLEWHSCYVNPMPQVHDSQ